MAHSLLKAGYAIASLTILDSELPDDDGSVIREYSHIEAIMVWLQIFEHILGYPLGVGRSDLEIRNEAAQRKLLHDRLLSEGLVSRHSDPDILRGPLLTFATSLRTQYRPAGPYMGPVQLVLVDDPDLDEDANRHIHEHLVKGWKQWAPNLIYIHAPGNHMTVLKPPHVKMLAGLIEDATSASDKNGIFKPQGPVEEQKIAALGAAAGAGPSNGKSQHLDDAGGD
jgi:hypothetical protein